MFRVPSVVLAILLAYSAICPPLVTAGVSTVSRPEYSNYTFNCLSAERQDNDLDFCHMIHWTAASAFNSSTFSNYYPGEKLPVPVQDQRAHDFYDSMSTSDGSSECRQAVKRLACTMFFPECPAVATSTSGIQSFPLCRLQCQQAENFCGEPFDCDTFTSENCMVFLPTGYFLLDPTQGPYDHLAEVYASCLSGWFVIALCWQIGAFYLYKDSSVVICKAVATLPLIKVGVLVLGTAFWTTCEEWMMCSFWLGVSLINTHLVYETGLMVCFLLIAKGWSITRENFSANEWRGIIISMSAFYMSNSIILVLEASVLTAQGFWIACTILYGVMYVYIVQSALDQLMSLQQQVTLLYSGGEVPEAIGGPLRMKYYMYIIFLFLVLCNIVLEISLHALLQKYGRMWIVLTVYEICDLVICGLIFFVFRPREFSPFFFMMPATLNDNRTRPIPIIEALDDDKEMAEIEISPLLDMNRNPNRTPSSGDRSDKMVIVRNPAGDVMVGLSPVMQSRSHHGGQGSHRGSRNGYTATRNRALNQAGDNYENRLLTGLDSLPPTSSPTRNNRVTGAASSLSFLHDRSSPDLENPGVQMSTRGQRRGSDGGNRGSGDFREDSLNRISY